MVMNFDNGGGSGSAEMAIQAGLPGVPPGMALAGGACIPGIWTAGCGVGGTSMLNEHATAGAMAATEALARKQRRWRWIKRGLWAVGLGGAAIGTGVFVKRRFF
jgi:hypothetical protein